MPFPTQEKHAFTEEGIESLGYSRLSGVYGIFGRKVCIYIGAADDIKARLREHLSAPRIEAHAPTYFLLGLNPSNGLTQAQAEFIQEYQPSTQHAKS